MYLSKSNFIVPCSTPTNGQGRTMKKHMRKYIAVWALGKAAASPQDTTGAKHLALAESVEVMLPELCACLLLHELHVWLELEVSELFLSAQWVLFPFDVVQLELMLHTIELLRKLELVQLHLCLGQFLCPWLCGETGATDFLVLKLIEL